MGVRDTAFLTLDHKGRQTFLSSLHEYIWEGPREALVLTDSILPPHWVSVLKKKAKRDLGLKSCTKKMLEAEPLNFSSKIHSFDKHRQL